MTTWKPIPSFPGYEAGSDGSIRSLKRGAPRLRAAFPDRKGYLRVQMSRDGCKTWRHVHTMVAEAFLGERPAGSVIRHLDGDHLHNAVANLLFGSVSDNILDQVRHGTHANASKMRCRNGHDFDEENTYRRGNKRDCRKCNLAAVTRYKARKQMAA